MTDTIKQVLFPILTAILGSGTTFLFFKQSKSKQNSDAFAKFPNVINDMLGSIQKQNEILNKIIDNQSQVISDLKRDLQKQDLRITELERVNRGLQNRVNIYENRTLFSEGNVCLNDECKLRKPKKGTFKGEEND